MTHTPHILTRTLTAGLLALAALLPLTPVRADENVPDRTHAADRQNIPDNALDPFSLFNQVLYGFETVDDDGAPATPGKASGSGTTKRILPNTKTFHGTTYFLVFRDEFSGTSIDSTQWITLSGQRKGGYWDPNAVYVQNGNLVLKTFKDSIGYKSGAINSKGAFQSTYGYFEVRIKFQTQQGHWPSFWLFNDKIITNTDSNGGKDGAEIDIVEKGFLGDRLQHALHWDGYLANHKAIFKDVRIKGLGTGFHTFGLLWTKTGYEFFIDGKLTWTVTASMANGICKIPLWVYLSDEIAPWTGDITKAKLPDYSYIDYVRVYRK